VPPRVDGDRAGWDRCCVYKGSPDQEWQDLTPASVRYIRAAADSRPRFDIALGGRERTADWDQGPSANPLCPPHGRHLVEQMGKTRRQAANHRRGEKGSPATDSRGSDRPPRTSIWSRGQGQRARSN